MHHQLYHRLKTPVKKLSEPPVTGLQGATDFRACSACLPGRAGSLSSLRNECHENSAYQIKASGCASGRAGAPATSQFRRASGVSPKVGSQAGAWEPGSNHREVRLHAAASVQPPYANSARTGVPSLTRKENPSGPQRVSGGMPSASNSVAPKSTWETGRPPATYAACLSDEP